MEFYRYTASRVVLSPDISVYAQTYHLLKETPCGYWIGLYSPCKAHLEEDLKNPHYWKKWVSKMGRKRYAYPTKRQALESFIIRKRRQIGHAENLKQFAESALHKAERLEAELAD